MTKRFGMILAVTLVCSAVAPPARAEPTVSIGDDGTVIPGSVAISPADANIVIGGTNTANVFPFGTVSPGSAAYSGEYQQIYTNSAFPGPVEIDSLSFATAIHTSTTETINFALSLSTTTASTAAPPADYAANKGADFTTVFSGTLTFTPLGNGSFDLVIPTAPFVYDPTRGNLLVDVVVNSASSNGTTFFVFGIPSPDVGRVFNNDGFGAPISGGNQGLLTGFSVTVVPEPTSLILLGMGIVSLIGYAWLHCPTLRSRPRIA
jgi:hypothetical protein